MKLHAKGKLRPRPLETCASVILAMIHIVYTRIKTLNHFKNPASSFVFQKIFNIFIFLASVTKPVHSRLLPILSVVDDHILVAEDKVETYFPSSTFIFLKISDFLNFSEHLPEKFDGFLKTLPSLMNRVVLIDWMLCHAISMLESLVNLLDHWKDKNKGTKEKEITVDKSFSRSSGSSISEEVEEKERFGTERKRATYKEALQRGSSAEDGGGSSGGGSTHGDPILELFETGWIQNPLKRSSRSADSLTFSRSGSYIST